MCGGAYFVLRRALETVRITAPNVCSDWISSSEKEVDNVGIH